MNKRLGLITVGLLSFSISASAELIFSEYVEGSSNNKALEIYNTSDVEIDLSDYSLQLFFNGNDLVGSTVNLVGRVAPQSVFVIANSNADDAILAVANQTTGSINFNGDDAIQLVLTDDLENVSDSIGQIGFDPGSEWGSGSTSTQNNTIRRVVSVTTGDTDATDEYDPSLEWVGFDQDTFAGLGLYDDELESPVLVAQVVAIYDIQGEAHKSPYEDQLIETSGIVTAVDSNGFYLQDPVGDANEKTSDGILVFTGNTPVVSVGDTVMVAGTVSEFVPGTNNLSITQISSPDVTIESSANQLPTPTIIGQGGRLQPTSIIDNDDFSVFDPEEDGIDFYESLEGMLVTVADLIVVSPTNRFGETFTLVNQGANATGVNARGGITLSPNDFNPERIQIQIDRDLLPGFSLSADVGDTLGDVTGVVNYSFGNFEVLAIEEITLTAGELSPESTELVGDDSHVTIASYNVENLDPVIEDINFVDDEGDIDDDVGDGKFAAIANQFVNYLDSPDIIALQEIQDNDGAQKTGTVDADLTAQTLINEVIAIGGPTYEYVELAPVDLEDGGQPGGNIRVAYLYNPARVSLNIDSPERIGVGEEAFESTRKSLYTSFEFNDETIHIINNHFSSKGGSSPVFGSVQPFVNGNVDSRDAQATVVKAYIDNLLLNDSEAKIVVLGDINEFYFEQPLLTLKGDELVNLNETLETNEIYSFVFDGNSQALDNALVSTIISDDVEFDVVHINSEFSDQASDHDPLVIRLNITDEIEVLSALEIKQRFVQQYAEGSIEGKGRSRLKAYRNLLIFNYKFNVIAYAIRENNTKWALKLIDRMISASDGEGYDLILGDGVAEVNQQLVLLRDSLAD